MLVVILFELLLSALNNEFNYCYYYFDLMKLPEVQNVVPNGNLASEEWTDNYVEGSSYGLILGTISKFS